MTTSEPRVLMVTRLFHPWVGGTERQALTLAAALRRAGTEVGVLTGRWFRGTAKVEVLEGVPVHRHHTMWDGWGVRGLRTVAGYLYMATLAIELVRRRHDYDVIHVHGMNYHSAVAVAVGRRLGKPTITKLANSGAASDVDKMRQSRQLRGARWLLPAALRSDRFVALSDLVRDELVAVGVERERVVSIPNGVDVERLRVESREPRSPVEVVYLGRLHPQKALPTLIEAVAAMANRADIRVRLVGDGPDRAELELQVSALGVGDTVSFVGETERVDACLLAAEVFVLPSRVEGLSNALLEAMAAGLAVVVSDIAANTAVVRDGVDGRTFPVGDAQALATILDELATDPELRRRLGAAARAEVEASYALDGVAARYRDLYAALTKGGA